MAASTPLVEHLPLLIDLNEGQIDLEVGLLAFELAAQKPGALERAALLGKQRGSLHLESAIVFELLERCLGLLQRTLILTVRAIGVDDQRLDPRHGLGG